MTGCASLRCEGVGVCEGEVNKEEGLRELTGCVNLGCKEKGVS